MIRHSKSETDDLVLTLFCDVCNKEVENLDYAECVWHVFEVDVTHTVVGHTQCTRKLDNWYSNNLSYREYVEKML